jgi:lysophospholipase L1-like esterase
MPALAAALAMCLVAHASEGTGPLCPLQKGERIYIHGDSVTADSVRPWGFTGMIHVALAEHHPELQAAVFGDGVYNRTAEGLISKMPHVRRWQPTLVVLYIGINDAKKFRDVERYRKNITTLIGLYQDMGARVVLCTPTVAWRREAWFDEELEKHAQVIRELGKEHELPVVDLRQMMLDVTDGGKPTKETNPTRDGVHLNTRGNRLVADALLTAFGCSTEPTSWRVVELGTRGVRSPGARWPGRGRIGDGRTQRVVVAPDGNVELMAHPEGAKSFFLKWTVTTAAKKDVREYPENPLTLPVDRHLTVLAHFGHRP